MEKTDPSSQPEQNPSLSWAEDEQEVQAAGPEMMMIVIMTILIYI